MFLVEENIQNTIPQPTPKQPVQEPPSVLKPTEPSKSNRFLVLTLSLLTLILLASTGYLAYQNMQLKKQIAQPSASPSPTSTPDPTANWKTYTNHEYGYSVEYPSDWKVSEAKPPNTPDWPYDILQENQLHEVKFLEEKIDTWPGSFVILVNKNPENFDTKSWASNYFVPLISDPTVNLAEPQGEISINNHTAYKFSVFEFDGYRTEIGLVKNGNIYMFTFTDDTPNDPNLEEHKEIYNQILSTFKFLETPSPTP